MREDRDRNRAIIFLVSVLIGGIVGITMGIWCINHSLVETMSTTQTSKDSELRETLPSYDTSSIDCSDMFEQYEGSPVDLRSFDTIRVIDMSEMFKRAEKALGLADKYSKAEYEQEHTSR